MLRALRIRVPRQLGEDNEQISIRSGVLVPEQFAGDQGLAILHALRSGIVHIHATDQGHPGDGRWSVHLQRGVVRDQSY